ncbi:sulfatase [candidate division KSB1 bacterium]
MIAKKEKYKRLVACALVSVLLFISFYVFGSFDNSQRTHFVLLHNSQEMKFSSPHNFENINPAIQGGLSDDIRIAVKEYQNKESIFLTSTQDMGNVSFFLLNSKGISGSFDAELFFEPMSDNKNVIAGFSFLQGQKLDQVYNLMFVKYPKDLSNIFVYLLKGDNIFHFTSLSDNSNYSDYAQQISCINTEENHLKLNLLVNESEIIFTVNGKKTSVKLSSENIDNSFRFICSIFGTNSRSYFQIGQYFVNGQSGIFNYNMFYNYLNILKANKIRSEYSNIDVYGDNAPQNIQFFKMPLNNDFRDCIAYFSPYSFDLPLKSDYKSKLMKFSIGIPDEYWHSPVQENFTIHLIDKGRKERLFEHVLTCTDDPADNVWKDFEIELPESFSENAHLEFTVSSKYSDRKFSSGFGAWGNPRIVDRLIPDSRYNVILISLDTIRKDRMSGYGYHRQTTPNIDRFTAESVIFEECISQASWTTPSFLSILTSLIPSTHGINHPIKEYAASLRSDVLTMTEVLHSHGYQTAAFIGALYSMNGKNGLYQGFQQYSGLGSLSIELHDIEQITDYSMKWLDENSKDAPFFLMLHTFETHAPFTNNYYLPDSITYEKVADDEKYISDFYDGDLRYTDMHLEKLFRKLDDLGITDNTLVIFTADHGYIMPGEHGNYNSYGTSLYDRVLNVPLIMRFPENIKQSAIVEKQVRSIDIAPTILDLLSIPLPDDFQGTSLVPLIENDDTEELFAYSEALIGPPERKSVRMEGMKYIYIPEITEFDREEWKKIGIELSKRELFNLTVDPDEMNNLAESQPDVVREMQALIDEIMKKGNTSVSARSFKISQSHLELLRSLGYIK